MTGRLSRRRLLALAGAGFGALSGCGYRPGSGDVRWVVGDGAGGYRPDDLLTTGETLFAVDRSVRGFDPEAEEWSVSAGIAAYDPASGERRWNEQTPSCGRPATDGQSLYLGYEDGGLAAFGVNGEARWETEVGDFPRVVVAAAGRVYALTDAGVLAAFAASDGERLWSGEQSRSDAADAEDGAGENDAGSDAALAAAAQGVYVRRANGISGSTITAVDRDGGRRWETQIAAESRNGRIAPVVGDDALYVPGSSALFALSLRDGTERWSKEVRGHRASDTRSVAVADGAVYHVADRTLYARDAADGSENWQFAPSDWRGVTSPPTVADEGVYVGVTGALYAIARGDGSVRWQVENDGVRSAPLVVGPTVVVATEGGAVRGYWRE